MINRGVVKVDGHCDICKKKYEIETPIEIYRAQIDIHSSTCNRDVISKGFHFSLHPNEWKWVMQNDKFVLMCPACLKNSYIEPCPYCNDKSSSSGKKVRPLSSNDGSTGFVVECGCGARSIAMNTEQKAIDMWNHVSKYTEECGRILKEMMND